MALGQGQIKCPLRPYYLGQIVVADSSGVGSYRAA